MNGNTTKCSALFIGLVMLAWNSSIAQNAYYDALALREQVRISPTDTVFANNARQQVYSILIRYDDSLNPDSPPDVILKAYRNNVFIEGFLANLALTSPGDLARPSFNLGIPSMNITSIAEGLTGFIISRTKRELNAAFFRGFKKRLDESEEFKILFPQTVKALSAIGDRIYNFNAYLKLLRESFHKDLGNLFVNFPELLDRPTFEKAFEKEPELKQLIKGTLAIIRAVSNNEHPGEIIRKIAKGNIRITTAVPEGESPYLKVQESIEVLNLFSESLRSRNPDRYWITPDLLRPLLEPISFRIYLGLVYQQLGPQDTSGLKSALAVAATRLSVFETYKHFTENLLDRAGLVDHYLQTVKDKPPGERTYLDYYRFYLSTVRLLEQAEKLSDLPHVRATDDLSAVFRRFLFYTESAGDLYLEISEQRYSSAIVTFRALYEELVNALVVDSALGNTIDQEDAQRFIRSFLKYGAFMAAVVEADEGEEVVQVIESFALPPGSYRIKRESAFSISLNSYLGGFAGRENLTESSNEGGVWGLTAPVGFSFSFGSFGRSAPTVFLSLVDLGGVASFRFEHDEEERLPELTLQNIIAPGAHLYIGIPGTPLVVGGGIQSGPQARKITTGGVVTEESAYRFHGMVGVDIPILTLFSTPQ
ncbi:MAG: hypothetical protein R3281_14090 [Balneolaceae bacterium]|nr:hypothetical protein [Balneolaceae bacterium]